MINQGGILHGARSDQKIHEGYSPLIVRFLEMASKHNENIDNELLFLEKREKELDRLKNIQTLYLASRIDAIRGTNSGSCKRDDYAFIDKIIKRFKKICIYDKLNSKKEENGNNKTAL